MSSALLAPTATSATTFPRKRPAVATLHRIGEAMPHLDLRVYAGSGLDDLPEGWARGDQLLADDDLLSWVVDTEVVAATHRYSASPRRDVAAYWVMQHYTYLLASLTVGAVVDDDRVVRIQPSGFAFASPGDTSPVAAAPVEFGCLPGDPDAGAPCAVVVLDRAGLYALARRWLVEHLTPVFAALRPHLRRGPRAAWANATDMVGSVIWLASDGLVGTDRDAYAAEQFDLLFGGQVKPFTGVPQLVTLPVSSGASYTTKLRKDCCLYYTLDSADACFTCPRITDAERTRRLEADPTLYGLPVPD